MKTVRAEAVPATGGRYEEIITTLKTHPSQWFEISPEELRGDTIQVRRKALYSAAAYRKVKITTRLAGDLIYVRLVRRKTEPANA